SISGSSLIHSASVSIAPPTQEGQNARALNRFKVEQAVINPELPLVFGAGASSLYADLPYAPIMVVRHIRAASTKRTSKSSSGGKASVNCLTSSSVS
ncbi:hypothetical protein, partial [Methylobacterium oxalidis]|uniref:hypothetical protein n=1 Tax=Methylobacterium oxalidis TaxID=944322 RepID=UPI0024E10A46